MYEAVIFDFDGVIIDSEPLHYEACCIALQSINLTLSYKEYTAEYLGLTDKEMFPQLVMSKGLFLSAKEIGTLIDKKVESYAHLINSRNKLPFVTGVEEFIVENHKNGIKMGICTGSCKTELLPVLERFKRGNLTDCFDVIITSEDVQYGKPSPEGYNLCLKRLQVKSHQAIAFEDSPYGIEAALKAGISVIALDTSHSKHHLQNASRLISDFNQLSDKSVKAVESLC